MESDGDKQIKKIEEELNKLINNYEEFNILRRLNENNNYLALSSNIDTQIQTYRDRNRDIDILKKGKEAIDSIKKLNESGKKFKKKKIINEIVDYYVNKYGEQHEKYFREVHESFDIEYLMHVYRNIHSGQNQNINDNTQVIEINEGKQEMTKEELLVEDLRDKIYTTNDKLTLRDRIIQLYFQKKIKLLDAFYLLFEIDGISRGDIKVMIEILKKYNIFLADYFKELIKKKKDIPELRREFYHLYALLRYEYDRQLIERLGIQRPMNTNQIQSELRKRIEEDNKDIKETIGLFRKMESKKISEKEINNIANIRNMKNKNVEDILKIIEIQDIKLDEIEFVKEFKMNRNPDEQILSFLLEFERQLVSTKFNPPNNNPINPNLARRLLQIPIDVWDRFMRQTQLTANNFRRNTPFRIILATAITGIVAFLSILGVDELIDLSVRGTTALHEAKNKFSIIIKAISKLLGQDTELHYDQDKPEFFLNEIKKFTLDQLKTGNIYNYVGPFTKLYERLINNSIPYDRLDKAAQIHDIQYGLAKSFEDIRKADDNFFNYIQKYRNEINKDPTIKRAADIAIDLIKTRHIIEDVTNLDSIKELFIQPIPIEKANELIRISLGTYLSFHPDQSENPELYKILESLKEDKNNIDINISNDKNINTFDLYNKKYYSTKNNYNDAIINNVLPRIGRQDILNEYNRVFAPSVLEDENILERIHNRSQRRQLMKQIKPSLANRQIKATSF